jgi:hypothetical protein
MTDVFVADEGPSGIGVAASNAPATSISTLYEQSFGEPEKLYLQSVLRALQLGKDLSAEKICVLCPDEQTVRIVNRETPLEPGSPLAPLYIRIRAQIHTYRQAEVRVVSHTRVRQARSLALTASRMPVRSDNPQYEMFALAG